MLNVAPQTERNPGHSGAMADASKAADAVDATGSLSVGALAVPDSGRLEACSICEAFSPTVTAAIADHCEDNGASLKQLATGFPGPRGAKRIATLTRSGQQACAGTCALRHHSRHNSAPALPPPSDDVRWGQSTPASSLIAREARPLAAASDLRRRLDRRWPRWRPT